MKECFLCVSGELKLVGVSIRKCLIGVLVGLKWWVS